MANEIQKPNLSTESTCPAAGRRKIGPTNRDWWPNQLNLKILLQNSPQSDPMGQEFNYAEEFKSLNLDAVIKDLHALMTKSQATFQRYGSRPLRRLAWHRPACSTSCATTNLHCSRLRPRAGFM